MKTEATLEVDDLEPSELADLYLPEDVWKKLVKQLNGNRLTVVLRFKEE